MFLMFTLTLTQDLHKQQPQSCVSDYIVLMRVEVVVTAGKRRSLYIMIQMFVTDVLDM